MYDFHQVQHLGVKRVVRQTQAEFSMHIYTPVYSNSAPYGEKTFFCTSVSVKVDLPFTFPVFYNVPWDAFVNFARI